MLYASGKQLIPSWSKHTAVIGVLHISAVAFNPSWQQMCCSKHGQRFSSFSSVHTAELVRREEEGISGVKDGDFIAAKILEETWTWSQEVNNLLICLASVLRIGMKNVSKKKVEQSVWGVRRITWTFVLSYFPSCRHQHPCEVPCVPIHHV